jgi:hypothetical protein
LEEEAVNVGVAAHITSAAAGGPRYDPNLTSAQRRNIKNAIWLCQTCAKLIDNDIQGHPEHLLGQWKHAAEQAARRQVGKAQKANTVITSAERLLKRDLKLRDELQECLLRPWDEVQKLRSRRGDGRERPFDKFSHSKLVIHRLADDAYPEHDDSSGISSWFRLEPFDFYHGGITFILGIESGVIENEPGVYAGNLHWAIIPYGAAVDPVRFRRINIWRLGLIPYRNIRHCDTQGDGYFPGPHLYCDFSINDMPYERFDYAVVARDAERYDWPLNPALRLPTESVIVMADNGPSGTQEPEPEDPAPNR